MSAAVALTTLLVTFSGPEGPLGAVPRLPAPGETVVVTCRPEGPLAGARAVVLRWSEAGAKKPGGELLMTPAGGAFTASVATDPDARALRLFCLDPSRPSQALYAPVYLMAAEARERLPAFPPPDRAAAPRTSAADAAAAMSSGGSELRAPISRPVRFDTKTETSSLVLYWRSQDGLSRARMEKTAAALEAAAAALKLYLEPLDTETRAVVYFKKRGPADEARKEFAGVAGRHSITIVEAEDALLTVAVHELTHFYTPDPGRCSARPGFCEGLAVFVAAAHEGGLGWLHERAARAASAGASVSGAQLSPQEFYGNADGIDARYAASGSFTAFLVERYGVRRVLAALAGASYERAFKKPLPQLEDDWRAFLRGF